MLICMCDVLQMFSPYYTDVVEHSSSVLQAQVQAVRRVLCGTVVLPTRGRPRLGE